MVGFRGVSRCFRVIWKRYAVLGFPALAGLENNVELPRGSLLKTSLSTGLDTENKGLVVCYSCGQGNTSYNDRASADSAT